VSKCLFRLICVICQVYKIYKEPKQNKFDRCHRKKGHIASWHSLLFLPGFIIKTSSLVPVLRQIRSKRMVWTWLSAPPVGKADTNWQYSVSISHRFCTEMQCPMPRLSKYIKKQTFWTTCPCCQLATAPTGTVFFLG